MKNSLLKSLAIDKNFINCRMFKNNFVLLRILQIKVGMLFLIFNKLFNYGIIFVFLTT